MHSTLIAATAALAFLAPALASSAAAAGQPADLIARDLVAAPVRSRHATRSPREQSSAVRRSEHKLKRRKCKASTSGQKVLAPASSAGTIEEQQNEATSNATPGNSGLGNSVDWDVGSSFLKVGNIFVGFLPDDGSGGGKPESMAQINSMLPAKSAWYGRYAQVSNGKIFDGSQLYSVLDDVKKSGAILAASVMPYGTWYGLTESDNRNAVAIAKVCNDIYKNHGVEVFLRFAHEMNWYQVDGTYSGGVSDFQTGWKVLSKAIEEHAPETKLWWSPNVGSDSDYERYYPKEGRVDIVGVSGLSSCAPRAMLTCLISSTGTRTTLRTALLTARSLSTIDTPKAISR